MKKMDRRACERQEKNSLAKNRYAIVQVMQKSRPSQAKSYLIEALQAMECHSKVKIFPFYWYFFPLQKTMKECHKKIKHKNYFVENIHWQQRSQLFYGNWNLFAVSEDIFIIC